MRRGSSQLRSDQRLKGKWALLSACFVLTAALTACRSAPVTGFYPHESVLSVIAELEIFLRLDPYRDHPGTDLEGRNIYRVTLARLDSLDEVLNEQYGDVLAFSRGKCLERLGRWSEAADAFAVAARAGTSLSDQAGIHEQWARAILQVTAEPEAPGSLGSYLNHLDAARSRLERLREPRPPFSYESFLMMEIERNLARKAHLLFSSRFLLPGRSEAALDVAQTLVDDHASSRLRGQHRLLLGGFFEALARDYSGLFDPDGARFDVELWTQRVDQARAAYTEVARADGDPAKPEGQARLRALDAFAIRTLQRAR